MIHLLLDTGIVSQLALRDSRRLVVDRIREHHGMCAIGSPMVHELAFGIRRPQEGRRRDALDRRLEGIVLPAFPVLPYEAEAAQWHAREQARLESLGVQLSFTDGQIAAVAAVNHVVLVTGKFRHFSSLNGLQVENWFECAAAGAARLCRRQTRYRCRPRSLRSGATLAMSRRSLPSLSKRTRMMPRCSTASTVPSPSTAWSTRSSGLK